MQLWRGYTTFNKSCFNNNLFTMNWFILGLCLLQRSSTNVIRMRTLLSLLFSLGSWRICFTFSRLKKKTFLTLCISFICKDSQRMAVNFFFFFLLSFFIIRLLTNFFCLGQCVVKITCFLQQHYSSPNHRKFYLDLCFNFLLFLTNSYTGSLTSLGLIDPKHKEHQYVGHFFIFFCEGFLGKNMSHIFCQVLTLHW